MPLKNLEILEQGLALSIRFTPEVVHDIYIGGEAELKKQIDGALDECRMVLLNEFIDQPSD